VSAAEALDITADGDVVMARLRGEIDLSNAKAIGSLVSGAVPNEASGVVLDLTDVTYLDSSGVHLVFELAERLGSRQQNLALVLPEGARIHRVLDLVNVRAVLPVATTAADGAAAVRPGAG